MPQDWKDYFNDPALRAWIAAALANNRDLRVAALRIEEARALYGVQRADRLPSVDGTAGCRSRASDPGPSRDAISQQYRAGVGITAFELDFFGRIKSLTDAALERYLASAEAHRAAALSLVAETATAYFNERSLAEQQRLTRSTLELRETTLTLTQRRYDAGLETAMGLRTAQMLVESSRATLAELSREHSQAVHALGLLAGDFSPARRRPDAVGKPEPYPAGGRPAVGAADAASGSAPGGEHAQGGQRRYRRGARGLFPVGAADHGHRQHRQQLLRPVRLGQRRRQFAPKLTLPIFNAGRSSASLSLAETRKHIAVAQYEGSIQTAFREVADALSARDALRQQIEAQRRCATPIANASAWPSGAMRAA